MKVTNYTDFRINMKKFLDLVENNNEVVIIKRSGEKASVVISLDTYNNISSLIKPLNEIYE